MVGNPALIIFIRTPQLGVGKRRLAASIGDQDALTVYSRLLAHTLDTVQLVDATRYLFVADQEGYNLLSSTVGETQDLGLGLDYDLREKFKIKLQASADLGGKMQQAFETVLAAGHDRAVIVGSDLPLLSTEIVQSALTALDDNEFVIGPATDGGYYLLGMKQPTPQLFCDMEWSTDTVFLHTLDRIFPSSVWLLPDLSDVDYLQDLAGLPHYKDIYDKHATGQTTD